MLGDKTRSVQENRVTGYRKWQRWPEMASRGDRGERSTTEVAGRRWAMGGGRWSLVAGRSGR